MHDQKPIKVREVLDDLCNIPCLSLACLIRLYHLYHQIQNQSDIPTKVFTTSDNHIINLQDKIQRVVNIEDFPSFLEIKELLVIAIWYARWALDNLPKEYYWRKSPVNRIVCDLDQTLLKGNTRYLWSSEGAIVGTFAYYKNSLEFPHLKNFSRDCELSYTLTKQALDNKEQNSTNYSDRFAKVIATKLERVIQSKKVESLFVRIEKGNNKSIGFFLKICKELGLFKTDDVRAMVEDIDSLKFSIIHQERELYDTEGVKLLVFQDNKANGWVLQVSTKPLEEFDYIG